MKARRFGECYENLQKITMNDLFLDGLRYFTNIIPLAISHRSVLSKKIKRKTRKRFLRRTLPLADDFDRKLGSEWSLFSCGDVWRAYLPSSRQFQDLKKANCLDRRILITYLRKMELSSFLDSWIFVKGFFYWLVIFSMFEGNSSKIGNDGWNRSWNWSRLLLLSYCIA